MSYTTPNIETVRRICLLHKVKLCYLNIETGAEFVELLVDLDSSKMELFNHELESWCGMKFKLY